MSPILKSSMSWFCSGNRNLSSGHIPYIATKLHYKYTTARLFRTGHILRREGVEARIVTAPIVVVFFFFIIIAITTVPDVLGVAHERQPIGAVGALGAAATLRAVAMRPAARTAR